MVIQIEISDPLASEIEDAAKSRSTSPEHYVLSAVSKRLAEDTALPSSAREGNSDNPLLGLLADEPELADFIAESSERHRNTLSMRASRG